MPCSSELTSELREGFAQRVAAELRRAKGSQNLLQKLEMHTDSPYGTGYERLHQPIILDLLQHGQ